MIIVVAEKAKYTPQDIVYRILEEVDSQSVGTLRSLIIFGEHATPIVDPSLTNSIAEAYSQAPIIPGRPNPGRGIIEAVETAEAYGAGEWLLLLLWGARSRIRHLDLYINYAIDAGALVGLIALRPSKPPWIDEDDYGGGLVLKRIRKNTNFRKLVSEVLGSLV